MYRAEFFRYVKNRFRIEDDIIFDIYQESFIALYDNIKDGKLSTLTSSLKTYLFRIGINKLYKYLEKETKIELVKGLDLYNFEGLECEDADIEMHNELDKILNELGEPCNTVLSLFYWKQKSMKEIAIRMNYTSEQVAKNRKSLCLKTLKEKFENLKLSQILKN